MDIDSVLHAFVPRLPLEDDGTLVYHYKDPATGRSFGVRRSEHPEPTPQKPYRYFLEEFVPNGRMGRFDASGHCLDAWEEPRIAQLKAQVGPNGLIQALQAEGLDLEALIHTGGGYCLGCIFHDSLRECATAVVQALQDNEYYAYWTPQPSDAAKLQREREQSLQFWRGEQAFLLRATQREAGLFRGSYAMSGKPLRPEHKRAILSFLNQPSQEAWLDIRGLSFCGPVTLWQAWGAFDPQAPRSGSEGFPTAHVLRQALQFVVQERERAICEKLAELEAPPLRSV